MRALNLSPLYGSMVGAERLAGALEDALRMPDETSYPPYDIEKRADDQYRITFAVAGFGPDELKIVAEPNQLTVSGRKASSDEQRYYLHRGIATRAFDRRFELADYAVVSRATYDNGMLTVELKREVPEAMKPRRISIRTPEMVSNTRAQPVGEAAASGAPANDAAQEKPKRARRKAA
ncbi:MAG: Hsp20 family protein [Pseudomonadota bacterium]